MKYFLKLICCLLINNFVFSDAENLIELIYYSLFLRLIVSVVINQIYTQFINQQLVSSFLLGTHHR